MLHKDIKCIPWIPVIMICNTSRYNKHSIFINVT